MKRTVDPSQCRVPPEKLRWSCPPEKFSFECTSELEQLKDFIGQDRAIEAIDFGLTVGNDGYNLFLTGLTGTGKANIIKKRTRKPWTGSTGKHGKKVSPFRFPKQVR